MSQRGHVLQDPNTVKEILRPTRCLTDENRINSSAAAQVGIDHLSRSLNFIDMVIVTIDSMNNLVEKLQLLQPKGLGGLTATALFVNDVETLEKVYGVNGEVHRSVFSPVKNLGCLQV